MKIRDIVVEGKVIVGPWAGSSDAVSAPIEKIAHVKNPTASDWIKIPLRAFRSQRLIRKYKRLANDAFEKSLEVGDEADRYEWTDPERFPYEKAFMKYQGYYRYFSMLAGSEGREFDPKAIYHLQNKYPELKQMYDADMQQEINTLTERKRKRKRKTTRTVYGGWWGGYPLDNSSGEGGGEGVAETTGDEKFDRMMRKISSSAIEQAQQREISTTIQSIADAMCNDQKCDYNDLSDQDLEFIADQAGTSIYNVIAVLGRRTFKLKRDFGKRDIGEQSVAEGKQEHVFDLKSIEEQFGEIKLAGGIVNGNQSLLRYLSKNNVSTAVFDHLIEQKIDKITKSNTITESIDTSDENLNATFSQFNNFSTGNRVKVGDSVSVLNLEALQLSNNTIELTGFLQPQTITAVNNNYVEFESGEVFPKQPILQLRMWRQVIFFHSVEQAKKCLMVMKLHSGKTGDWEFSINVNQGVTEATCDRNTETKLSWTTLGDSLSVEDKLTIFEEYYCKNTLLESNSEQSSEYFKSLFELSDEPVAKQRYIVVPLMLVSDRIMQLDSPSVMKYVGSKNGVLLFTHNNTEREYPPTTLRHRSLSHTFTFATRGAYDKFRIALRLKFDVELSNVNKSIDEASSAAQQAAIAINMKRAGKKPQHNK